MEDRRCTQRVPFFAAAEVKDSVSERNARVTDLSIHGCYLTMPDPYSEGASVLIRIRTPREFFQCGAFVAHSTPGMGMGLEFDVVSPPFQNILQGWLLNALAEVRK